ncbi:MAG: M48 family metallopeptidase [Nitrospiraceae bacterium]
MGTIWSGYYLDGRSSARQPVSIQLFADTLRVTTESQTTFEWRYNEIHQTQGSYAGEQVRLERGGECPELLLVPDVAFLAALHRVALVRPSHIHNPAHRRWRSALTLVAGLAVIIFVAIQYVWGIPGLAAFVAPHIPVSWEERLGRTVVERLAPAEERCNAPGQVEAIQRVATPLIQTLTETPYEFHIIVLDSPVVNAFAAPGGYVVVFKGLLERTQSPEELAGVLSHEMQHIEQRHVTRALLEQISTGLLISAISGDPTGGVAFGVEGARALGMLRYSRNHEADADTRGIGMLLSAGVDPNEMIAFYRELQSHTKGQEGVMSYLSTHPSTEERIMNLQTLAKGTSSQTTKIAPDLDWPSIRSQCYASPH